MKSESVGLGGAKGWGLLVLASLVMLATLPARTSGLGLITEPLIGDLGIARVEFARLNLWATVIGALFVFVAGWALDRVGLRWVTAALLGLFAGAVFWLTNLQGAGALLGVLILIRGLGQSALSLAAIAIVGKWFRARLSVAMGVFAVLTALLFVAAIAGVVPALLKADGFGWRESWATLACAVLVLGVLVALFLREPPAADPGEPADAQSGMSLGAALRSPVLWALTIGTGIYYFAFSAMTLLNVNMVASVGLDEEAAMLGVAILMGTGLVGNLGCGWLAQRIPVLVLFGASLLLFAACLFAYPHISGSKGALCAVMAGIGVGGGAVVVVFFTGFAEIFGRRSLGKIQGVAQGATVAASGTGPLFFESAFSETSSYAGAFNFLAGMLVFVGIWTLVVRKPKHVREPEQS